MALAALAFAQLGWALLLGATAWAAGWLAWGRRRPDGLVHPFTVSIGLALLGTAMFLLAALGLFRPPVLATFAASLVAGALPGWRKVWAATSKTLRERPAALPLSLGFVVLAAGGPFLISLLPPTGFDETTYHLPLAQAFLAGGGLPWEDELRVPAFPLVAEGLQAALLAHGGERATHLVALVATLGTALLLRTWGTEAEEPAVGWLAAAVFVGSPLVAYLGGTGYVDAVVALFSTAVFYGLWRSHRERGNAWPAVAGLCAGAAASVKYLGFFSVLAGLAILFLRREERWQRAAAFVVAAAATVALPYGYLLWRTGNPLFPFFGSIFGHSPWSTALSGQSSVSRALLLPWNAVLRRDLAGHLPPISPALLLGLLPLSWALARAKRFRAGVALLVAYLAALAITPVSAHYLMPVLPLWCLLTAASAMAAWRPWRGEKESPAAPVLLALALALPGVLYGAFFVALRGGVPVATAAREAYLSSVHPGYDAVAWLQDREGDRYVAYCLACEHLHGLAQGRLLGEWSGPYSYARIVPLLEDPPKLRRVLREMGAQYLLLPVGRAQGLRRPSAIGSFTLLHRGAEHEVWAIR